MLVRVVVATQAWRVGGGFQHPALALSSPPQKTIRKHGGNRLPSNLSCLQEWLLVGCPSAPLSQANAGLSVRLRAGAPRAGQAAVAWAAQAGPGRFRVLCLQVVMAELSPVCLLLPSHCQEQRASSPQHVDKCLVGEEWAQRGNEDQ